MTSWKRITLVIFILIGGTAFFGYWSTNQFNRLLDDLSTSSIANTMTAASAFQKNNDLATTSPETYDGLIMIDENTALMIASTTIDNATTTTIATSTEVELAFTFPQKGDEVYIGCTYPISWQSSTTINSLGPVLVDAGTGKSMGPIASGLAEERVIEEDFQNLNWKVGVVWPGMYYIKILKINGLDTDIRSKVFLINDMPEGISKETKVDLCLEFSV